MCLTECDFFFIITFFFFTFLRQIWRCLATNCLSLSSNIIFYARTHGLHGKIRGPIKHIFLEKPPSLEHDLNWQFKKKIFFFLNTRTFAHLLVHCTYRSTYTYVYCIIYLWLFLIRPEKKKPLLLGGIRYILSPLTYGFEISFWPFKKRYDITIANHYL